MKPLHTAVAVVGIAAAAALAWWWQQQPTAAREAAGTVATPENAALRGRAGGGGGPVTVEVARAERATVADDVHAVGSLKSARGVMLRPEVGGRVARLGFTEGGRVRRGQVLVQLDDTLQQAQLQEAQAQASIARTNLERSRELVAQGFVSQSAVDQNAAALAVAEAQVALARAQAARMRVVAPFDGTAGLRAVNVGDYVRDGADLVAVEDLDALQAQFALPERYVGRLRPGQPVEVTVDALPGQRFDGRVQAFDVQVAADGRALQVRAEVGNAGARLKPGMFARVRVVFAQRDDAVVVPEEALVPEAGRQLLFKVVDAAGGGKVAQRLAADVGLRLEGRVEIVAGIAAGDAVVTAGQARLLRGGESQPVRVVQVGAAASGASAAAAPSAASVHGATPRPPTAARTATVQP